MRPFHLIVEVCHPPFFLFGIIVPFCNGRVEFLQHGFYFFRANVLTHRSDILPRPRRSGEMSCAQ